MNLIQPIHAQCMNLHVLVTDSLRCHQERRKSHHILAKRNRKIKMKINEIIRTFQYIATNHLRTRNSNAVGDLFVVECQGDIDR